MSKSILKSNNSFVGAAFLSDKEAFHTSNKNLNLFNLVQSTSFSIDVPHERQKQLGSATYIIDEPFFQPDVSLEISYLPNTDLNNEKFNFFSSGNANGLRPALSGVSNASTNFYLFNNTTGKNDALDSITFAPSARTTTNYTVTVQSVGGGNRYFIDGVRQPTLELTEGNTYVFDWSDSSAQSHPVRFSTTSDGTHGGGSEYTVGVTKDDSNYKTTIVVALGAPTLYYYCQYHAGMGGQANTISDAINYTVTVQNVGGNKYFIDGVQQPTLELIEGNTYVFDWSDSSAQGHPFRFSTTSNGTHAGGSEYTVGVTKDDSNYKTYIAVATDAPTLYYYCQLHSAMGGQANTPSPANNLDNYEILAFGNAFLTNYSLNYAIGGMPLVSTSYICSTMKFEEGTGNSMEAVPVNLQNGTSTNVGRCDFTFVNGSKNPPIVSPVATNSEVTMQNLQIGGQNLSGIHYLQSVNLNLNLSRISSYGLGSDFAYNRKLQLPAQGSFSATSLVSGFNAGELTGLLSNESSYSFDVVLASGQDKVLYRIENAKLESYSYEMSVNEIMTFNSQFSFPVNESEGLLISGTS